MQRAFGGDDFAGGECFANLHVFEILRRHGFTSEHLFEPSDFVDGERVGGTGFLERGAGGVAADFGESAGAGVERRGGHRLDDGDDGFAGGDLGAGLERHPAQLAGDGRRDDVALADARFAFFAHGGAERAVGGARGLGRCGLRAQAVADEDQQRRAAGVGQPAEAADGLRARSGRRGIHREERGRIGGEPLMHTNVALIQSRVDGKCRAGSLTPPSRALQQDCGGVGDLALQRTAERQRTAKLPDLEN